MQSASCFERSATLVYVCVASALLPGATALLPIMSSLPIMSALESCKSITVDFIIKDNDPEMAAVEDDIVQDLAKIGITVNTRKLDADAYREAELKGDFHMLFTRTCMLICGSNQTSRSTSATDAFRPGSPHVGAGGAPYDPHSYLTSWAVPAHVEYSAIGEMDPPLTRAALLQKITDVQIESDPMTISNKWAEILQDIHSQALFLPLWGTRIPYVLNRRFAGFIPSTQTYAYPLNSIKVMSGSRNVTVAPGAGGSLFSSIGPVNPHQYYPNQLFVQGWVYEGLVGYGQDGEITPALASSWVLEELPAGGRRYIFTLREGVKFHDGSDWNCAVAKLNFDHVLSDIVKDRHQWYGTPQQLTSWTCDATGKFVLETKDKYYPLLQELSYIRPLTFAAATAFAQGLDSDADTHNSCNSGVHSPPYLCMGPETGSLTSGLPTRPGRCRRALAPPTPVAAPCAASSRPHLARCPRPTSCR